MEEFDLIELLNFLWRKRSRVILVSFIFFCLGVILYLSTPKQYKATITLLSEIEESSMDAISGLGALSGIAGIELPSVSSPEGLPSSLYPDVLSSLPFLIDVYQDSVSFDFDRENTKSIESYFLEHPFISPIDYVKKYTVGLPGVIMALFREEVQEDVVHFPASTDLKIELTNKQAKALRDFGKRLSIIIDDTNGLITISVVMPDKNSSADLAIIIKDKITKISTNYKLNKLRSDLGFINSRYLEAKQSYSFWQRKVADYADGNNNIYSAKGNIERSNIQDEYSLAYSIYQSLAKQREQKEIELKQETPVFTVLEPVMVPLGPDSPNLLFVIFGMTFLGFGLACASFIFYPIARKIFKS